MYEILLIAFLLVAIGLIGLIMLQQGKGADMGASFGAGASGTLFGSSGSANFMSRTTAIFAILFFIISLALGNLTGKQIKPKGEFDDLSVAETQQTQAPVKTPAPSSDVPN
jgi:preprotein translocase subunit SecG